MSNKFALSDIFGISSKPWTKHPKINAQKSRYRLRSPTTRRTPPKVTTQPPWKPVRSRSPPIWRYQGALDQLVETARDYAKAATAENTNKAYAADWKHFTRWCRLKGTDPLPPSPQIIGLYLTDLAAPTHAATALSVSTIDRRLSGLVVSRKWWKLFHGVSERLIVWLCYAARSRISLSG